MIEFPAERIARVRRLLEVRSRYDGYGFDLVHRTLSQSYKAANAKTRVAEYVGAISFLFVGRPEDYDAFSINRALVVAETIFAQDPAKTPGEPSRGLLYDHAKAVLTAQPVKNGSYVDMEAQHLTFLGGELLFRRIVEALVQPYVEEPKGRSRTNAETTATDVAMFLRPETIKPMLKSCRHWAEWETALRMGEMNERSLVAGEKETGSTDQEASPPREKP